MKWAFVNQNGVSGYIYDNKVVGPIETDNSFIFAARKTARALIEERDGFPFIPSGKIHPGGFIVRNKYKFRTNQYNVVDNFNAEDFLLRLGLFMEIYNYKLSLPTTFVIGSDSLERNVKLWFPQLNVVRFKPKDPVLRNSKKLLSVNVDGKNIKFCLNDKVLQWSRTRFSYPFVQVENGNFIYLRFSAGDSYWEGYQIPYNPSIITPNLFVVKDDNELIFFDNIHIALKAMLGIVT